MAGVIFFENEHRAAALRLGHGGNLLHASEEAEHHGVIGYRQRDGLQLARENVDVPDAPLRAVLPQDVQRRLAAIRRRHPPHIGRQRQTQVAQSAPRVADVIRTMQRRQHPLHQPPVVVAVFRSRAHKAHHFLVPLKH